MKEEDFLTTIKSVIGNKYIGDDCAYLKDIGIIISQDNLVEDVHFSLKYTTIYKLGYKSAIVNISDICASGAKGKYMSVGLSLPNSTDNEFIKEFYNGLKCACTKYGYEIIGGDITGSKKIMISIAVIGTDKNVKISSRKNAKTDYVIVTSGTHGLSAAGLKLLKNNISPDNNNYSLYINSHLMPEAQADFSKIISENIKEDYAMTDSSDGLADALYKIAKESNKTIILDFNKVNNDKNLENLFKKDYKDLILYGGEDYQLVGAVPKEFADKYGLKIIGKVIDKEKNIPLKVINFDKQDLIIDNIDKCFNHFDKN